MEEIVGQAKWTTTNHTKDQSLSKEGDAVNVLELEGSPLFLPENQMINFKYCSQLNQIKVYGISQQKCIIFH